MLYLPPFDFLAPGYDVPYQVPIAIGLERPSCSPIPITVYRDEPLIGSLGSVAFLRFFICSAVMRLYYFFVGLLATYDVAHQDGLGSQNEERK